MRYYTAIRQVVITERMVATAKQFASDVVRTTNYSDSNQYSLSKIEDDHFVSKLGEEAAKLVLSKYALVKGPDYSIYESKNKSWDDDLYIAGNVGIAVKTQKKSAAQRYGLSWTFQAGAIRKDTILHRPDAWVVFVEFDDLHPYHCDVYPPYQVKELTFGEPFLEKLRGHKKVVYADTLPVLG